jgi:hypothetical protein
VDLTVRPSYTLGQVVDALQQLRRPSPDRLAGVRVAPSAGTTFMWSHTGLPQPRRDVTLAENGITSACVLRWDQVAED